MADSKTRWKKALLRNWYGRAGRTVEFCSDTAIWYHGGLPSSQIRWVLIRDPQRRFDPLALLSTDLTAAPLDIIKAYVCRWQVEVTFEESRLISAWKLGANGPTKPLFAALRCCLLCSPSSLCWLLV